MFFLEAPDKKEFVLQEHTLPRLTELVIKQLNEFDRQVPNYSRLAREEAKSLGYDWGRYINLAIQHQVCMRAGGVASGLCWSGVGDKIHAVMQRIDKAVESSPNTIKKVGESVTRALTKIATGHSQKKFGGCKTCGGRRTFSGSDSNLGRVNKINSWTTRS